MLFEMSGEPLGFLEHFRTRDFSLGCESVVYTDNCRFDRPKMVTGRLFAFDPSSTVRFIKQLDSNGNSRRFGGLALHF
jgi:hypothetical protein